ncbi:MAG: hypothetical protein OXG49_09500 [Chloroflexi bacterium]|nr:hypothetical protein [Chloroflexota bacterium]
MISLDDVVLQDDLAPRLGERDTDLIQQYTRVLRWTQGLKRYQRKTTTKFISGRYLCADDPASDRVYQG